MGKSALAVELAEVLNGEIVGADAFQIYSGLEILTAQPDATLRQRVVHHLIGSVPCQEVFNAGRYLPLAEAAISDIRARGKVPIVVGGTGLYIKALTHGISETPQVDVEIREKLEAFSLEELLNQLKGLDPDSVETIDTKNRRRVQRALEICLQTGEAASKLREEWKRPSRPCRGIVLTREREELTERIHVNILQMLERGVMEEIRSLKSIGATAQEAIGYRDAVLHLNGSLTREQWVEQTHRASCQYAKRQLTWFKNQTKFPLLKLSAFSNLRDSLTASLDSLTAPLE